MKKDFYRIDVGNLLNDHFKYALLAYFITDTSAQIIIHKLSNNEWIKMFDQELTIYRDLNDFSFLRFEDFSGDGIYEILIPKSIAPSHENFAYYCLTIDNNAFKLVPQFEELIHPAYQKSTKTIHTLSRSGIGNYMASEYKLENWDLCEIKQVNSYVASVLKNSTKFHRTSSVN